mgnify:CR=1 FL=1
MNVSDIINEKTLKAVAKNADIDAADVAKVAAVVLPVLMSNMSKNAKSKDGAESLMGALMQHADDKDDSFDMEDGAKILGHILGSKQETAKKAAAAESGIDAEKVAKVAAMLAPVVLSSLGKQAKASQKASAKEASGVDALDVATTLLGMFAK